MVHFTAAPDSNTIKVIYNFYNIACAVFAIYTKIF